MPRDASQPVSSLRTIAAPPSASSLARETARLSGTMPQLVQGTIRSGGAYSIAVRMVAATCSGVSITSVATSMAPWVLSVHAVDHRPS
jgi:hypothetical protein